MPLAQAKMAAFGGCEIVKTGHVLLTVMGTAVIDWLPWKSVAVCFFQAEDGIRDTSVTGVQTCALPILHSFAAWATSRPACRGTRFPPYSSNQCLGGAASLAASRKTRSSHNASII